MNPYSCRHLNVIFKRFNIIEGKGEVNISVVPTKYSDDQAVRWKNADIQ